MRHKIHPYLLFVLLAALCLCLSGCEDEDERVRQALIDMGYMAPTATPEPTAAPPPTPEAFPAPPVPGEGLQVVPEFPGDAEHLSPAPDEVLQDIRDRLEQMREQLPSGGRRNSLARGQRSGQAAYPHQHGLILPRTSTKCRPGLVIPPFAAYNERYRSRVGKSCFHARK